MPRCVLRLAPCHGACRSWSTQPAMSPVHDSHMSLRGRPLPEWEFRDYLGWQEQGDGKLAYGIFVQVHPDTIPLTGPSHMSVTSLRFVCAAAP